ncbi:MAG: GlcNAc-PI de-N-acetylase [Chloroflexi bacterium]|nr:MAG: GlcNAc-PI de-N-acetylase [Chloroflexota bacterium]
MPKVLLAVLAHPDDETFGMGGTLALYARRGVDVYLVCGTRGEVGEMDPKYMRGFTTIAERREAELRCAAENLGLKDVYFLNYRDSGMPGSPDNAHPQALVAQPLEKVAADIARYIRLLKPQVIITFDSIGGYRHPDHIATHNATVLAFQQAGKPDYHLDDLPPYQPQKLYFHTMPHGLLRAAVSIMPLLGQDPRRVGTNKDIDLVSITEVRFPIHARIDYRPVAQVRDDASACHASQGGGRLIGGPVLARFRRWFASSETFMRAYPEPQPDSPVERDLFAGVIPDD